MLQERILVNLSQTVKRLSSNVSFKMDDFISEEKFYFHLFKMLKHFSKKLGRDVMLLHEPALRYM